MGGLRMAPRSLPYPEPRFDDATIVLGQPLGQGAYGFTWRGTFEPDRTGPQNVVVKVLKPNAKGKLGSDPSSDFEEEVKTLRSLRHWGIVRVLRLGQCAVDGKETPYYLAEWEEAASLDKCLESSLAPLDPNDVLRFVRSLLEILDYCHRSTVLHLDLKPDNILLKWRSPAIERSFASLDHCILIDFGKAKVNRQTDPPLGPYTTPGGGVWDYVHPKLRPFLRGNRVARDLFSQGGPGFDLFSVAQIVERDLVPRLSQAEPTLGEFVRLLSEKLQNIRAGEHGADLFTAAEALESIHRFQSGSVRERNTVRLSTRMTVATPVEARLVIDTPEVQRLRKVQQLGLTHLVYPSATHTRFSHSLGAFHLAGRYAEALSRAPAAPLEFKMAELAAVQLRALLHDLGHYPMAHYLEEFGSELRLDFDHSRLGRRVLQGEIPIEFSGPDGNRLQAILRGRGLWESVVARPLPPLLNSIISGSLDCDKLDYLIRDGVSCGVPYAESIDVDRFLSALACVTDNEGRYQLGLTPKGISAAETMLTARYQLFAEVYWHKTCRAAVAMFKEAFRRAVGGRQIKQSTFEHAAFNSDDGRFLEWVATNLRASDPQAADELVGNALMGGGERNLYKRIVTYAPAWALTITQRFYSEMGARNLRQQLNLRATIVKRLNQEGRRLKDWRKIREHQILVDVPPANKARLGGDILVRYPAGQDPSTQSLEQTSELVKSLTPAFNQKAQRIRIFCHPMVEAQIRQISDGNPRKVIDGVVLAYFG